MLGDLVKFRDLLGLLVLREIRIRYARAFLGAAWAVFLPMVMLGVFVALDFGRLMTADARYASVSYSLFAFCGILPWAHFAASLTQATPSIVNARDIIRKSAFPREVIPLSKVLAALLDLAIGCGILALLLLWKQAPLSAAALSIPVVFLLQMAFTAGLALLLSAANTFFRDVHYIVQVILPIAMFATSVVYPVAVSNRPFLSGLLSWNPVSSYIDSYRIALLLGEWPWGTLLPGAVGAALSLAVGTYAFGRLERRFAEEL
jgi:ABC-2 type transport system permease protein/lipopolysaccharide transport system permease protein